jgi:hypothetical protein
MLKRMQMLPSLLDRDNQKGLEQFLLTGVEASYAYTHGVVPRFVEQTSRVVWKFFDTSSAR